MSNQISTLEFRMHHHLHFEILGGVVENIDTLTVDHYVIVATIDYE